MAGPHLAKFVELYWYCIYLLCTWEESNNYSVLKARLVKAKIPEHISY